MRLKINFSQICCWITFTVSSLVLERDEIVKKKLDEN